MALTQGRPGIGIGQWFGNGVHQVPKPMKKLKAPFPAFGGKSRIAALVWDRLGDVDNFIEPFANSAAVLLARPHAPRVETVNDLDCYIANVWRSLKFDPDGVAEWADLPVNEACMHAEHRWLVGVASVPPGYDTPYLRALYTHGMIDSADVAVVRDARLFRHRMRTDPDYYDVRRAGRWLHGACCWIGGGWCSSPDDDRHIPGGSGERMPGFWKEHGILSGTGTTCHEARRPVIANDDGAGRGVHGNPPPTCEQEKRPRAPRGSGQYDDAHGGCLPGVHGNPPPELSQKLPRMTNDVALRAGPPAGGRPQLADAYSRGRGVHNDTHLSQEPPLSPGRGPRIGGNGSGAISEGVHRTTGGGTCAQRRAWLVAWFGRLRDRLRTVRVCCGSWLRVCDSESVTTRLGTTGILFDPPYSHEAGRDMGLYAQDSGTVAHDVRRYCLERGDNPMMRLALCGYRGEGHEELERHGWERIDWKAQGGYGNRSKKGKANARKEAIWFSAHCRRETSLYDGLDAEG